MAYSDLSIATINQYVVRNFKKRFLPLLSISHRFDHDGPDEDVVKVPVFTNIAPNIYQKAEGVAYQSDSQSPTKVDVLIDQRAHVADNLSAENLRAHSRVANAAETIAEGLVDTLLDDFYTKFFANITEANFATTAYSGDPANFDYDDMVDFWKTSTDAWGGRTPFGAILSSSFWANILKDSRIVENPAVPDVARGAMLSVKLPAIGKGTYTLGENIPANGAEQLAGMLLTPDALAVGFKPAPSVCQPGEGNLSAYQVLTDDETGVMLTYRQVIDGDADVRKDIYEIRWGAKVLDASKLKRVVDTTL